MTPKADFFFEKTSKWQAAFKALRTICASCDLNEEVKWGVPCYTYNGHNVVLIHGFKAYCALLFHKGALMSDPKGILIQQTKNVQAARQLRFTSAEEIRQQEITIKSYILNAIEIEKMGLTVKLKKTEDFDMPLEFERKLNSMPALKHAFYNLTPGRQRAYLLYFSSAKKLETRVSRIEKQLPNILDGRGLNDA